MHCAKPVLLPLQFEKDKNYDDDDEHASSSKRSDAYLDSNCIHGYWYSKSDVHERFTIGDSVRIVGKIIEFSSSKNELVIIDPDGTYEVIVDTSILFPTYDNYYSALPKNPFDGLRLTVGSQFMIFGEVQFHEQSTSKPTDTPQFKVVARIAKDVDTLNYSLYKNMLGKRKKYIHE